MANAVVIELPDGWTRDGDAYATGDGWRVWQDRLFSLWYATHDGQLLRGAAGRRRYWWKRRNALASTAATRLEYLRRRR